MDDMLRKALRKHNGLRQQLDNMLLGDNGDEVEMELKKFLTKRPCWIPFIEKPKPEPIDHTIDLESPVRSPFHEAVLEVHRGKGVVKLEKRDDILYLDDKPLSLFLSKKQKKGSVVVGHDLRKELEKKGYNVSAKVLDYLFDHPELWPESWKKDAQGDTIYVFFWDDIFRYPANGSLFVRYGYWDGGRVVSRYGWLDSCWDGSNPAASSAS